MVYIQILGQIQRWSLKFDTHKNLGLPNAYMGEN